jgi:uncharacterized protein (TIGR03067 family)
MYASLLILAALATAAGDGDNLDGLQGTWNLVSTAHTKLISIPIEWGELTIQGDRYTRTDTFLTRGTVKWDETQEPRRFERTNKDSAGKELRPTRGIYRLEEDTYTECYSIGDKPLPSQFESKPRSLAWLDVWKRTERRGVPARGSNADRLQGTWKLASRIFSGAPTNEDDERGFTLTFRGSDYSIKNEHVGHGTLKLGREVDRGGEVDLTYSDTYLKGRTFPCMYQREGYFLRIRQGSVNRRPAWFGENEELPFSEYLYERAGRPDLGPEGVAPSVGYALGIDREGRLEFRTKGAAAVGETRTAVRRDDAAAPEAAPKEKSILIPEEATSSIHRYPVADLRVYDTDGRRIPKEKVAGLFTKPRPILYTHEGYLVDPEYLRVAREGTPFVVLPED